MQARNAVSRYQPLAFRLWAGTKERFCELKKFCPAPLEVGTYTSQNILYRVDETSNFYRHPAAMFLANASALKTRAINIKRMKTKTSQHTKKRAHKENIFYYRTTDKE